MQITKFVYICVQIFLIMTKQVVTKATKHVVTKALTYTYEIDPTGGIVHSIEITADVDIETGEAQIISVDATAQTYHRHKGAIVLHPVNRQIDLTGLFVTHLEPQLKQWWHSIDWLEVYNQQNQ